jgi:hypothetical protein
MMPKPTFEGLKDVATMPRGRHERLTGQPPLRFERQVEEYQVVDESLRVKHAWEEQGRYYDRLRELQNQVPERYRQYREWVREQRKRQAQDGE